MFKANASSEASSKSFYKTFGSYNRTNYKPSIKILYTVNSGFFDDATKYCINNKYTGKYVCLASSSSTGVLGVSGKLNDLEDTETGRTVNWIIKKVAGGYVICEVANTHKYLSAINQNSNAVEFVQVVNSTIPTRCIWTFSATTYGYTIKNNYTGKYLYSNNNGAIYTEALGTQGSSTYYSETWRIETRQNCQSKELSDFDPMDTFTLLPGESKSFTQYNVWPNSSVLWKEYTDFTYTGYNGAAISYNSITGKFNAVSGGYSSGAYTVTMKHKVTGLSKTFRMITRPNVCMVGIPDTDHNHHSFMDDISNEFSGCISYNSFIRRYGNTTVSNALSWLDDENNNVFVSRCHGQVAQTNDTGTKSSGLKLDSSSNIVLSGFDIYSPNGHVVRDLSNLRLAVFVACESAKEYNGGHSIARAANLAGAGCSIGFKEEIICGASNTWTQMFFEKMADGCSVNGAIDSIMNDKSTDLDLVGTNLDSIEVYGDSSIKMVY